DIGLLSAMTPSDSRPGAPHAGHGGAQVIRAAMRRPITVMVMASAVALAAVLAAGRMAIDIFPDMGVPIIYVAQPYGGMDPAQMEGFITNYYEYHFLYVTGIEHVESKNIQGTSLMKLF